MKVGVLGAGQLGRMLALAGTPLGIRCRDFVAHRQRLLDEQAEHLALEVAVAHRLAGKVDEVHGPAWRLAAGFAARHRERHVRLLTHHRLLLPDHRKQGLEASSIRWTAG